MSFPVKSAVVKTGSQLAKWKKSGVARVKEQFSARAAAKEAIMLHEPVMEIQERYRRGEDPYSSLELLAQKQSLPPTVHCDQFYRGRQAILDWFADLPYNDGRLLYKAIGRARPHFLPAVGRLKRRVEVSNDMQPWEKKELYMFLDQQVEEAWKYFQGFKSR